MWRLPRRTNKELPESESPTPGGYNEDIPYGLRISDDCQRLEVDPVENRTLMLMMELLVQDIPYSSIVSDLNEKGLRMRDGRPWTRVAVFNMTPASSRSAPACSKRQSGRGCDNGFRFRESQRFPRQRRRTRVNGVITVLRQSG